MRPAPVMRTTAVNIKSDVVLERQRKARAELRDLAVLADAHVELGHFRDAQVAQRAAGRLHRIARRVFPRVRAGADHFRDAIDRAFTFFGHDRSPLSSEGRPLAKYLYPMACTAPPLVFDAQRFPEAHGDCTMEVGAHDGAARRAVAREHFRVRMA